MDTKLTITLGLVAGFVGGLASGRFIPVSVYAQQPTFSQEIRAQKFVLVDRNGEVRGAFGMEENGTPQIEVAGWHGRTYATVFRPWSMVHGILAESGSHGPKEPTLLPVKP